MTDSAPEAKSMIFSWLGSCIPSNNDSKTKVTYEGFTLNGVTFNIGDCGELSVMLPRIVQTDYRLLDYMYDQLLYPILSSDSASCEISFKITSHNFELIIASLYSQFFYHQRQIRCLI